MENCFDTHFISNHAIKHQIWRSGDYEPAGRAFAIERRGERHGGMTGHTLDNPNPNAFGGARTLLRKISLNAI